MKHAQLEEMHRQEKNPKNKDVTKKVNKSLWEKFLNFKSENQGKS